MRQRAADCDVRRRLPRRGDASFDGSPPVEGFLPHAAAVAESRKRTGICPLHVGVDRGRTAARHFGTLFAETGRRGRCTARLRVGAAVGEAKIGCGGFPLRPELRVPAAHRFLWPSITFSNKDSTMPLSLPMLWSIPHRRPLSARRPLRSCRLSGESLESRQTPASLTLAGLLPDPNPQVGSGFGSAVVALPNGNVVVSAPFQDVGAVVDRA